MSASEHTPVLPARRPALVMRALADLDQYVVKNGHANFYDLDERSYFLLAQLDGRTSAAAVRAAYQARFGEPLTADELAEFVATARERDLLQDDPAPSAGPPDEKAVPTPGAHEGGGKRATIPPPSDNSVLCFRVRLVDPDRLLAWLAPRLWFFFTPAFVLVAAACILAAAVVAWDRRADLGRSLVDALAWRNVLLAWAAFGAVTVLHEFAHGLTCKRYGGEVSDMGFLMLFFMPCFYANVSDAWLFPRRSQRLWVTFAGGFFELWVWSLAVFAWAVLVPGTLPHRAAYLVAVTSGVQTLFNFNPLLKLDGYYLLSDWLGVVNLRERAASHLMARLRRLLWGAAPPDADPRGRVLLAYGLLSLAYSLLVLTVSLFALARFGGHYLGAAGLTAAGLLCVLSLRGIFTGISRGEVTQMLLTRCGRSTAWVAGLSAAGLALSVVTIPDRASGPCRFRPAARVEVRAPVAGFVREVRADEGSRLEAGSVLAVLDVPELASRTEQKQAEVREARARLRLLEVGPRPEEVAQQRRRVERAAAWRDLAVQHLSGARLALQADLERLDGRIAQHRAELEYAADNLARVRGLAAVSRHEYAVAQRERRVAEALGVQAEAQKRARQAAGAQDAESELAHRDKELTDEQARLALLEVGSRPEDVEAERARLERLQEELRRLGRVKEQTRVTCRSAGVVVTPRLRETVGQFVKEGDLIAVVEDASYLEAEVTVPEGEAARVRVGQRIGLKVRALPSETFPAAVVRVAPSVRAADPDKHDEAGRVVVYCRLDGPVEGLRSGMTGYARIYSEERSVGSYVLDRAIRFVRTEFWW
jgi:multidrug efflux pump subunit AcrA (membrane-fusion protein)